MFIPFFQPARSSKEKQYKCPVCLNELEQYEKFSDYYLENFFRYRYIHSIFDAETFNYFQNTCPHCKTGDSNRLYALYFRRKFDALKPKKMLTFIDFAPVPALANVIKSYPFIKYRSADLYNPNVDDQVDIQDMHVYKDSSVDFFLCSHMLEHVPDDGRAVRELYRILKPKGWGIIMVPISLSLTENFEKKVDSDEERWHYFGQGDHLRMYSKPGFLKLLKQSHFKVDQLGVDYFGTEVFSKAGIEPRSILYVVSKS